MTLLFNSSTKVLRDESDLKQFRVVCVCTFMSDVSNGNDIKANENSHE